jgi:hypothetical protein
MSLEQLNLLQLVFGDLPWYGYCASILLAWLLVAMLRKLDFLPHGNPTRWGALAISGVTTALAMAQYTDTFAVSAFSVPVVARIITTWFVCVALTVLLAETPAIVASVREKL